MYTAFANRFKEPGHMPVPVVVKAADSWQRNPLPIQVGEDVNG